MDDGTIDFNQSRANSMGGGEGSCPNSPNIAAESAVNIKSGNLHFTLDIGSITLAFNSVDTYDGPLGRHWTYNYNHRLLLSESDETKLVLKIGDGNIITYYLSNGVFYPEFVSGDTSQIVKNPNGTYSRTMKNGTIHEFDTSGRLALIKGRNIYLVTYLAYYDNGFTIADPNGRVTILTVSDNRITSITPSGPGDRTYHLIYTNGLLTSVSDPLGNTWLYVYDSDGKLSSKSDPEGQTVSYTYDSLGRLWTATDPEGRTKTMVYDGVGKTKSRDKDGNYSTYYFDPAYTVKTAIQDDFGTTRYTYDARRNLTSVIARDGAATSYAYDESGNLASVTTIVKITTEGVVKRVTNYGYNALNQLTSTADANEHVTLFGYTGDDLTSKTEANGAVTQYRYDLKGNLVEVIAPPDDTNNRTTTMTYDSNNNLHTITDPKGGVTTLNYDTAGNVTGIEIPSGSWTFEYNALNYMTSATDALGKTSLFTNNFRGDRLSVTDANGNTTGYSYNYRGQLLTITDALNRTTRMSYGQTGCSYTCGGAERLASVTDAMGHITRFTYDTRGRLLNEMDDQGKATTFLYDTRDNLTGTELPDGRMINYRYDLANQLRLKYFSLGASPGTDASVYSYDDAGNLRLASKDNTFHWLEYDTNNRITSISTQPQSMVWYEYYLSGKRKLMLMPYDLAPIGDGRPVGYTYDESNRLTKITTDQGEYTFGYDSSNRRTSRTLPNGIVTNYSYDANGRITGIETKKGNATIDSIAYVYDDTGNLTSKTDLSGTRNYEYDALYRVTKVTSAGVTQEEYAYDPVGNRLSGSNVQLTDDSSSDQTTYSYDYENRLVNVTRNRGGLYKEVSFAYDAFGRRFSKTIHRDEIGGDCSTLSCPRTTYYVHDGPNVIVESNGIPRVKATYVYGPGIDEPLSVEQDGQIYYYHADGLGSITALSDAQGNIVQRYEYDAFGNFQVTGNITQPYTYTGREFDPETGLYYYRARYYDPKAGRFLQRDPIGFAGGDVDLYAYVQNNPVNWMDPWGLIRYNAPPPRTVPVEGATLNSLECLERCLQNRTQEPNLDLLVTGGSEQSGHSRNSRHYSGEACDVAGPQHNPVSNADVSSCAEQCGFGRASFESFPNNPNRAHWHLEMPRTNNR
jgi:RHS repeat-associated protein